MLEDYNELVDLRNRLAEDGPTYQEDHLLLDRILDRFEELMKGDKND